MACGRVAVQVKAPGRLQDSPQFHQAGPHHREVGQHVVGAQQRLESTHGLGDLPASLKGFFIGPRRGLVPVPSILEGFDLGSGARAVLLLEEDIVGLIAVEGRIQIDQIHRVVGNVAPQNIQVVAVIEMGHKVSTPSMTG